MDVCFFSIECAGFGDRYTGNRQSHSPLQKWTCGWTPQFDDLFHFTFDADGRFGQNWRFHYGWWGGWQPHFFPFVVYFYLIGPPHQSVALASSSVVRLITYSAGSLYNFRMNAFQAEPKCNTSVDRCWWYRSSNGGSGCILLAFRRRWNQYRR